MNQDMAGRNFLVVEMYNDQKLSIRKIGKQFNITPQRVHQILKQAGVKMRNTGTMSEISPASIAMWKRRYEKGDTATKIANDVGKDVTTILRYLHKHKVKVRRATSFKTEAHLKTRETGIKTCSACGFEGSVDDNFWPLYGRRDVGDGYMAKCKKCINKQTRERKHDA